MRTLADALRNAARIKAELPHLLQPGPEDEDMVNMAARIEDLESALDTLLDHAMDVRGYADGWEWKYGKAWDAEESAARSVLHPQP